MKRIVGTLALLAALVAGPPMPQAAEQVEFEPAARSRRLDVDVWINKDEGGVYRPGESMRVYFRTNSDAYVLVFNIDTEGYVHLIYPYGPGDSPLVETGRPYRIPSRSDPYDIVADGPEGVEYVVAVASPYPFRNLPWYLSADRADGGRDYDDEDDDDGDNGYIVGDPYVGIDRIIRRIAPGREDEVATSETYFYIGRRVEYPRYVCADCHYRPYYYFDPYLSSCSVFEIRIDATWAHYAPFRYGSVRPRYIYRVRPQAPTRYRQWKDQWSSLDGRATLRQRFLPERDTRYRRQPGQRTRPTPPEFRDLRRYREGRFWRGRDQILRLRERREEPENKGRDRPAEPGRRNDDRPGVRERGRPDNPGWGWGRREERPQPQPDNRGDGGRGRDRERREPTPQPPQPPPQQREDRGWRDRGDRDRGDRDRGDRGDRDRGDRGWQERREERRVEPREERREERREQPREQRREERKGDRGDRDRGRDRDDRDRGNHSEDRDDNGRGHDRRR